MNKPRIEDILAPRPEARPRLYAWSSSEVAARWQGCLKVGQTTRDVNERIRQSQGQARLAYHRQAETKSRAPSSWPRSWARKP